MALIVGVSGKIGSGKDYLTSKLREALEANGWTTDQTSFAKALKQEVTNIIDYMKANHDIPETTLKQNIAEQFSMTEEQAGWLVDNLSPELDDPDLNGWSRTLGVRSSLQLHGTEIRRSQQPSYWTDLFLEEAKNMDADFVFVSDGRFPNEMDCVVDNAGITFRLEIPEEILEQRRTMRDGIIYTPEQLNHVSETSLDDYDRFDYVVGEVVEEDFLREILEMRYRFKDVTVG